MFNKENFFIALTCGNIDEVKKLTQQALDAGEPPDRILKKGLIAAMDVVGLKFKNGEIYIPELIFAGNAMHAGIAILNPILSKSTDTNAGKVVIGTVKGDLHDIGKKLVVMMLEAAEFEVVDLGIDVPATNFVEAIQNHKPQVVGMSALLTSTMPEMKYTIQTIEGAGLRSQIKTIVGGAPVTESFAKEIGVDGYAPNATSAVDLVKTLIRE